MKHIKKFESDVDDYLSKIDEYKEKNRKKEIEEENLISEFNKLKLNKYLVLNDLNFIYLGKLDENTINSVVIEILYDYNKNDNTLKKYRRTSSRRIRFYKSNFKKENILVNTDDLEMAIDYLKRLHDSKKYNL